MRDEVSEVDAMIKRGWLMQLKAIMPGLCFFKPLIFIICLLPFASLVSGAINQQLGPNPVEAMIRGFGDWGIYFILIGLTISPARKLFKLNWLIQYRRMIGLFAFFYVCMHFSSYIWFEQYFDIEKIIQDIIKRPFIAIGFVSFLMLIPLAITSTNKMMRRLKKNWARIHKLIYPVSILTLLHYFMMVKADYLVPIVLLVILSGLLGYRFLPKLLKRS